MNAADEWLTLETAFTNPVPVIWWEAHSHFGARTAAAKQWRLSESVAEALLEEYLSLVIDEVDPVAIAGSGVPIVEDLSITRAVSESVQLIEELCREFDERDLVTWLTDNAGGIRDLVTWQLSYSASAILFSANAITFASGDEISPMLLKDPTEAALVWANVATLAGRGEVSAFGLAGNITAWDLLRFSGDWDRPPYGFGH